MVQPVAFFVMNKKTPTTKAVVTVLMIVWYVLEIVKTVIELLR